MYVDDQGDLTYDEANAYCESEYGTTLAIIDTQTEFDCILDLIDDGDGGWIGLYDTSESDIGFFEFIDDPKTDCIDEDNGLYSGLCVYSEWWQLGQPKQICAEENGSKCVRIKADIEKINNDIQCENTLSSFVCDAASTSSAHSDLTSNYILNPNQIHELFNGTIPLS